MPDNFENVTSYSGVKGKYEMYGTIVRDDEERKIRESQTLFNPKKEGNFYYNFKQYHAELGVLQYDSSIDFRKVTKPKIKVLQFDDNGVKKSKLTLKSTFNPQKEAPTRENIRWSGNLIIYQEGKKIFKSKMESIQY